MKKLTVRQMAIDAMLVALFVVLSKVSVNLLTIKVTFDSFPILVGAALFGPLDGMLIGLLGSFIDQLTGPYGLTVTTPLWMLPAVVRGLMVGAYAKHFDFELDRKKLTVITVVSALVVTALNSGVMYIDSRIFGYDAAILAFIIPRILVGVVTAVVFAMILPPILNSIKKAIR